MATFNLLQQPFEEFVLSLSPDWLIVDCIPHWAIDIGRELDVPVVFFLSFSATAKFFFGPPAFFVGEGRKRLRSTAEDLMVPPPWVGFPSSSVAYRKFEAIGALTEFYGGDCPPTYRICKLQEGCEAVAIRSCNEFEGQYLQAYAKALGKPVLPTGLLTPESRKETSITDEKWIDIVHWLGYQKEKSVTFVGFGSEWQLKKEEIYEIALGLELSELPFLWSLRKPIWVSYDETCFFPPNFIQNTSKRGKVCFGWAPQMEILGHPSIGASLFHTGWGSVIENLQFGHRLVVLPMIADQGLNTRLEVEKSLATEVERGEDGSFTGEGIANALKQAMIGYEGEIRLKEVAAVVSDSLLQDQYIQKFVQFLKHGDGSPGHPTHVDE